MSVVQKLARAAAVIACAGSVALTGASASNAGTSPDPMYGAATVGSCRNYTIEGAYGSTETSADVDCATQHTAKVIAVVTLPESLTWAASSDTIAYVASKKCEPARAETLGGTPKTRKKSAYVLMYFIPTKVQRDNGARWIRCDIALWGGKVLQSLPTDTSPFLPSGALPDAIARCLTTKNHIPTVCAKAHNFRATGVTFVDQDPYPGEKGLLKIANNRCPKLVSTPSRWYVNWPSKSSWRAGDHLLTCFSNTSD